MKRSAYVRVVAGYLLVVTCVITSDLRGMMKEQHPLYHPTIREAFADGRTLISELQDQLKGTNDSSWITFKDAKDDVILVNKKCGRGLLDIVNNKRESGISLLEQAAQEKSGWAHFYLGFLNLVEDPSRETTKAFFHFDEAEKLAGPHANTDWYNHILVTAGMAPPQYERCNAVMLVDKLICVGRSGGNLAYPLSMYARSHNDEIGERLCLEAAIQYPDSFYYPRALNDYGTLLWRANDPQAALHYFDKAALFGLDLPIENARVVRDMLVEQEREATLAYSESSRSDTDAEAQSPDQSVLTCVCEEKESINANDHNDNTQRDNEEMLRSVTPVIVEQVEDKDDTECSVAGDVASSFQESEESQEVSQAQQNVAKMRDIVFENCSDGALKKYAQQLDEAEQEGCEVRDLRSVLHKVVAERAPNEGQRVSIWQTQTKKDDSHAQYQLGVYYIDHPSDKKKSRTKEGWSLLKQAADKNHSQACYEFIIRGLESKEREHQEQAAAYGDELFEDQMRMNSLSFADEKIGHICALRGMYALKNEDTKQARLLLQHALDHGNTAYAYELATLHYKQNDFKKAQESFARVSGEKQKLAHWYRDVLLYARSKDEAEKDKLIQQIVRPLWDTSAFLLPDVDLATIFTNEAVVNCLQKHADLSAHASYLIGYRVSKGLGGHNVNLVLACDCFIKAIAMSNDEELKSRCVHELRSLETAGCEEAKSYLKKNFPTQKQKQIDNLYQCVQNGEIEKAKDIAFECELQVLADEVDHNDTAAYFYGLRVLGNGKFKQDKKLLEMSIPLLQRGKSVEGNEVDRYVSDALLNIGELTRDEKMKREYYERSATLGSNAARIQLYVMHLHNNDEERANHYLEQAVKEEYSPALIVYASTQMAEARKNNTPMDETRDIIDKLLADNEKMLSDIKVVEKGYVYSVKGALCIHDKKPKEAITWWRKAVQAEDITYGMTVALDYAQDDDYSRSLATIQKMQEVKKKDPSAYENKHEDEKIRFLQLFIENKRAQNNDKKQSKFIEAYLNFLLPLRDEKKVGMCGQLRSLIAGKTVHDIEKRAQEGNEAAHHLLALLYYTGDAALADDRYAVDYQKAYEYAEKAGPSAYILKAQLLHDGGYNGEIAPDPQAGFDALLEGLAQEKCTERHREGRNLFVSMITGSLDADKSSGAFNFIVKKERHADIEKIYHNIAGDMRPGNGEDLYIVSLISEVMANRHFIDKDIPALYTWYTNMIKWDLSEKKRIDAKRFESLLHEHNAFKQKTIHAGQAALRCLEEIAEKGDVYAQQRLIQLFGKGAQLACGAHVMKTPQNAHRWANALVQNPAASPQQKGMGYLFTGVNTIEMAKAAGRVSPDTYISAMISYHLALAVSCYDALPYYIAACTATNQKEDAVAIYEKYREMPDVWNSDVRMLMIGKEMLAVSPVHTKNILDKVMPLLRDENVPHILTIKDVFIDYMRDALKLLVACNDKPEQYGFDDMRQLKGYLSIMRIYFKRNPGLALNGVLI